MRKQYYIRPSPGGLLAWDVDRLVKLSRGLPRTPVPLSELLNEASLAFPIILASDGAVMDGMHRVAKAVLERRDTIDAVRFAEDPAPDYVGRQPDELPY